MKILILAVITLYFVSPSIQFDPSADTGFLLYTQSNKLTPQTLTVLDNVTDIWYSNFDAAHDTRILIHGWNSNGTSDFNIQTRDEYLFGNQNCNVISVDWSVGANGNYVQSSNAVGHVALTVSSFIQLLMDVKGADPDKISIIGYSLGAHIAGSTGKQLRDADLRPLLGSIMGLEPPAPAFFYVQANFKLQKGDAKIVHTMKTSILASSGLGDANFVANGGSNQPLCNLNVTCNHARVWVYFKETINSKCSAKQCQSSTINASNCNGASQRFGGFDLDGTVSGFLQFTTNSVPRYTIV